MLSFMPSHIKRPQFIVQGDDTQFASNKECYEWIRDNLHTFFPKDDSVNMKGYGIVADGLEM